MSKLIYKFWERILQPILQRPKKLQVAAMCYRGDGEGREYLLVTSRGTGRWIIPKGWPIRGLQSNETALQEAWEEAGVKKGKASNKPIGSYNYDKKQDTGWAFPVETLVYSVAVEDLSNDFPESHQRTVKWVSANEAANLVDEPELKSIFLNQ